MLVWIFPRGCLMQSSLPSSVSTALSVEPETRSSAEVANLLHILTICSSFGKKKKEGRGKKKSKRKRKHQNSRVGQWCLTAARATGPPRVAQGEMTLFGAAAPQRIKGTDGSFLPASARSPGGLRVGVKSSPVTPERGQEKHGAAPSQTSQCFVPAGGVCFFFFSPRPPTIKVTIASIINYALMAGEGLD